MKVNCTNVNLSISFLAIALILSVSSFSQCITTVESRENITTNATSVPGNKTETIGSNSLNVAYKNQGNGTKLTLNFSGNNNTYKNDTIRFVGSMSVESISRGNNSLNGIVFVVTENSTITFKNIDINNSSNIKFINYGVMQFENSITMASNTIFINKTAASVLIFKKFTNFANNSNTTVLYANGGIVNFLGGFQLQGNNKFCLTANTQVTTTSIGNDVTNGIYVPASFSACLKYTSSATLNNKLTSGPGNLNVAQSTGASNASNSSNWGTAAVKANTTGCNLILPVVLKNFEVVLRGKSITANWSTSTELNVANFEIERSVDGVNYKKIGTVNAKGFSNVEVDYSFTDPSFLQTFTYYYRLKMIDRDGKYNYSGVRELSLKNPADNFRAMAIAGSNNIMASFPAITNKAIIMVSDVTGKIIYQQSLSAGQTTTTIVPKNITHGNYFVILVTDNKKESLHIVL